MIVPASSIGNEGRDGKLSIAGRAQVPRLRSGRERPPDVGQGGFKERVMGQQNQQNQQQQNQQNKPGQQQQGGGQQSGQQQQQSGQKPGQQSGQQNR